MLESTHWQQNALETALIGVKIKSKILFKIRFTLVSFSFLINNLTFSYESWNVKNPYI